VTDAASLSHFFDAEPVRQISVTISIEIVIANIRFTVVVSALRSIAMMPFIYCFRRASSACTI